MLLRYRIFRQSSENVNFPSDFSRVQKMSQPSSGCITFIIDLPLLGKSKLAKVLELCIVHVSKNCMVEGICLSQSMSH